MPEQAAITQNYKLSDAQWARWPHWSTSLTGVVTQRAGSQLSLTGRIEDHRQLASWLQGQTAAPVPATRRGEQRYTLTVQNQPRERVLDSLTRQLDLELQWDGVGEVDRSQRVSLQLQNATLDELLRAVLRDGGLTYQLVADSLIVSRQVPARRRGRPTARRNPDSSQTRGRESFVQSTLRAVSANDCRPLAKSLFQFSSSPSAAAAAIRRPGWR